MEKEITESQVLDYCQDLMYGCEKLNINYEKFPFYTKLYNFYHHRIAYDNYCHDTNNKGCVDYLEDIAKEINWYYESKSPEYRKYKLENIIKKRNGRR